MTARQFVEVLFTNSCVCLVGVENRGTLSGQILHARSQMSFMLISQSKYLQQLVKRDVKRVTVPTGVKFAGK